MRQCGWWVRWRARESGGGQRGIGISVVSRARQMCVRQRCSVSYEWLVWLFTARAAKRVERCSGQGGRRGERKGRGGGDRAPMEGNVLSTLSTQTAATRLDAAAAPMSLCGFKYWDGIFLISCFFN